MRPKSTKTNFVGQNRPKPVISVPHPFLQSKSTKTTFVGQSQPKPVFFRSKLSSCGQIRRRPIALVKIHTTHFFWQKSTKTSCSGQPPVCPAKIDRNQRHLEKFRAEHRKMKTARWRPKRDKQTPFSSVLIPGLD